ncbi:hypothetical protein KI387_005688, partial [Taxus chinensis]
GDGELDNYDGEEDFDKEEEESMEQVEETLVLKSYEEQLVNVECDGSVEISSHEGRIPVYGHQVMDEVLDPNYVIYPFTEEITGVPQTQVGGSVKEAGEGVFGDQVDKLARQEDHFEFFSTLEGKKHKDQHFRKTHDGYADYRHPFRGSEVDILNGKLEVFLGPDSTRPLDSSNSDSSDVGWTE